MPPGLYSGTSSLSIGIGLYQSVSGLGGVGSTPQLATAATFGNALWTTSTSVNRFSGPWLFAPVEPGITTGFAQISNTFQSPKFDYRKDWYIKGLTHFASTTPLNGALSVQGGKKGVLSAFEVSGAQVLRTQVTKMAQHVHVEGMLGVYSTSTVDQDGLYMGGAGGAKLTASISTNAYGTYLSVTNLAGLTYNSKTAQLAGDVIIGGTLGTGAAVLGTQVIDYGKVNCIGSISGTTLTTTSEVGAPIVPGISNTTGDFGMAVYADGGTYVGVVTVVVSAWNGTSGTYTINNPNAISVAAGSRIFIESTGTRGSYLLDTAQTVSSTFIEYFPPTQGYYGVPNDVPTDRIAAVAASYGPAVTRQTIAVTGTHGTNLCKLVYGGISGSGLNAGPMSDLRMTGTNTCQLTLAGIVVTSAAPLVAWAKNTAYGAGDRVTGTNGRTYVAKFAHTSGNQSGTTFNSEWQAGKWVAPDTAIAGWYPMGAWVGGTSYLAGDVVTSSGSLWFCRVNNASTTAPASNPSMWTTMVNSGNQTGWVWKLTATGYDPANPTAPVTPQVLPVGHFNRDWHLNQAIGITGTGGAGTVVNLIVDSSYTGNLPASNAVAALNTTYTYAGVVTPAQAIFAGAPINGSTPLDGTEPGEHADSLGQMDADKFCAFLGTDRIRASSSYQAGGITSASGIQESTEESSRIWWKWALGLTPGEDPLCNIVWSGMQQVVLKKPKRYYQTWVDIGDRTWADWSTAPFPNASLRPTATQAATGFSVANGFDATNNANYYAMGGAIYSGGHFQGSPPVDFAPASVVGFNATLGTYSSQRDPAASEMLSLTFQNDTTDTLTTASSGTRIGWFKLNCSSNFPGVLAAGERCIVDATPSATYLGLGSSSYGAEAVRGRLPVPIGNNPTYVTCSVRDINSRGINITKTFGPYNIIGVPPTGVTTSSLSVSAPISVANTNPPTAGTVLTIGTNTTGVTTDQIVGVVLASSSLGPRTISKVLNSTSTGTPFTLIGLSSIQKTDSGTGSGSEVVAWYRLSNLANGANADVYVEANALPQGVAVYSWFVQGIGSIYDVATKAPAGNSTSNQPQTVTVGTPIGGAIFGLHSFSELTGTGPRRASAAYATSTAASTSTTVGGTAIGVGGVMTWTGATKVNDITVVGSAAGASALSVIVISPSYALDVNCISATLTNGNIAQAGTPTYVTSAGVVATAAAINTPRFDYSLGILRGLYVEPSRTNLITRSNVFNGAGWSNNAVSLATGFTGPDGTASAANITFAASNYMTVNTTVTAAASYTASVYVKVLTGTTRINLGCGKTDSTDGGTASFDLTSTGCSFVAGVNKGTGTYVGYSITQLNNGWFRISCTAQSAGTSGGFVLTVNSPYGDIQMFGAQLELGADASSYIPTTSAAVTRAADTLNITSGISVSTGTHTARCWHISGDFTDVAGVTVTSGTATLSGVSTKPIQAITFSAGTTF